ncbi:MAG: hypothetical protein R2774_06315 [Saprospiraceae bacterium]
MKKLIVLALFLPFLIMSCSKDDEPVNKIVGKWKFRDYRKRTIIESIQYQQDLTTELTDDSYFEFSSNGTFSTKYADYYTPGILITENGTYSIFGDSIALTYDLNNSIKEIIKAEVQYNNDIFLTFYVKNTDCYGSFSNCTYELWMHLTK